MNSGGHFPVDIPGLCPPYCASSTVFTTQTGTTLTIAGTRMTDPGSAFGTDSLTLVSPAQTFNTATGAFIPSFATLSIHLIPEPGTLLLLSSGAVGLALYGRRRMRK